MTTRHRGPAVRARAAALLRVTLGLLALAAAPGTGAQPAVAGAAEPIPAEVFFRRPAVLDVELSPSGRWLALSTEKQGRVGLFVIDLQSGTLQGRQVALFSDADVRSFRWVDDERLLFGVVDLQSGSGVDHREASGLFAVRHDGSELRALIERRGRPRVTDGSRLRTLPVNHRLLHVPVPAEDAAGARADEVIVGELRGRHKDLLEVQPLWLNTRTGRTRSLDTDGAPEGALRWWFSAQGQPRAVATRDQGRDTLHAYRPPRDGQAGRWVRLAEAPMGELPLMPAWVGRGDTLYVQHRVGPAGELVLAPFDFATGRPGEPWVVTPGFDFHGEVLGDRDGDRVLGVRVDAETEHTVWFDAGRKALQARIDEALPGRVNRISCRRCDADDAVVVVRSWSDRQPGQLLLRLPAAPDGQPRWRLISQQQPGVDPDRMARLDLVRVRARDGRPVPVWLTRPADFRDGQPRPAVVLVHGGPWVRGGHWRWNPMAQFLASRGYVVIEPEFRGSAGYGAAHERAGDRQFGQAMQDDVTDALRWAQAQKIASDKACIAGGSYGGYSTLMGLIREPELFRCGSAWFAVADLLLYVEGGWFVSDDIPDAGREHFIARRVGHPDKDRALLLAHSPVEQAHRIRTPLQLVWGTVDLRVPIAHGHRLRSALRKAGQEPEWVEYEHEAHGLRTTANQVDMALKLEAFLARHLR